MKNYKQEMFTKVYRHLLTQKKKSKNSGGCLYRGPAGTSCAVGCLISDKKYSPSIEGTGVWEDDVKNCLPPRYRNFDGLLEEVQCMHDRVHPSQWKKRLEAIAKCHDLKIPKL